MYNFKDLSGLNDALDIIHKHAPGVEGKKLLEDELIHSLRFSPQQARVYAGVVLSENLENSSAWMRLNAGYLFGSWRRGNSDGSAGNLVVSRTVTWTFNSDLTFEYKQESYEGYSNPFGGGYSSPSSSIQHGIWAPCDRKSHTISIVIIKQNNAAEEIQISFPGYDNANLNTCVMQGFTYAKY